MPLLNQLQQRQRALCGKHQPGYMQETLTTSAGHHRRSTTTYLRLVRTVRLVLARIQPEFMAEPRDVVRNHGLRDIDVRRHGGDHVQVTVQRRPESIPHCCSHVSGEAVLFSHSHLLLRADLAGVGCEMTTNGAGGKVGFGFAAKKNSKRAAVQEKEEQPVREVSGLCGPHRG
jgi:hypothetical protein